MESTAKPKRKRLIVEIAAVIVAAVVISSVLFVYYSPDYSWSTSIRDHDGDGYADADDAFPYEASQWSDADGDGYGDNANGENPDAFPNDANEYRDSDGDGVGDNGDDFPNDGTQTVDSDGDGYGDNSSGNNPDHFPTDSNEWNDSDDDGVGDNLDWWDSANACLKIYLDYYKEDGTADFWTYGDPFFVLRADMDGDSTWEFNMPTQIHTDSEFLVSPNFWGIDLPDDETPPTIAFTIEVWESDLEGDYEMDYNPAVGGSYWTVQSVSFPYSGSWSYNGSDDGGYELDCELQFSTLL